MGSYAFAGAFPAILLGAALLAVYVPELVGTFRRQRPEGTPTSPGSSLLLYLCIAVGIAGSYVLAIVFPDLALPGGAAVYGLGLVMLLGGAAFRWYAIRVLGRWFDRTLQVKAGQRVVDVGPYAWVRHPSYTGAAASLVGVGVAMGNGLGLVLVLLVTAVGYGYRIRVEERMLLAELGEPYRAYAKRVPYRLVPRLW